jgi:hypothetical protein
MARIDEAQRLDDVLDRLLAGEDPGPAGALADLVEIARDARSVLAVSMPPSTQAAHLRLVDEAVGVPDAGPAKRRRIAVVAIAASLAVSLLAGSAYAVSAGSSAGQPLFAVKRAFERAGLAMRYDRASRASFKLEIVQRRLAELRSVAGDVVAEERARAAYEDALDEADRLISASVGVVEDDALLGHVQQELHHHVAVLSELLGIVPEQARDGIQRALDRAAAAEERAASARGKPEEPGRGTDGRSKKSRRITPPASRSVRSR